MISNGHRFLSQSSMTLRYGVHRALLFSTSKMFQVGEMEKKGYTLQTLPSPFSSHDKAHVGRPGVKQTNLCDPDNILTKDTKDILEGCLNGFSQENLAKGVVAIVNKVGSTDEYKFIEGGNNEKAIEKFTRDLHDLWGIGDKDTQNGLLLFMSVRDRAIFISTGRGIQEKLTKKVLQDIISEMKPALRAKDYDAALEFALMQIEFVLKGVPMLTSHKQL